MLLTNINCISVTKTNDRVCVCLGAQDDLKKVTDMAYDQIRLMGMNEKVGLVSFPRAKESQFIGQPYSQQTTQLIDDVSQPFLAVFADQIQLIEHIHRGP